MQRVRDARRVWGACVMCTEGEGHIYIHTESVCMCVYLSIYLYTYTYTYTYISHIHICERQSFTSIKREGQSFISRKRERHRFTHTFFSRKFIFVSGGWVKEGESQRCKARVGCVLRERGICIRTYIHTYRERERERERQVCVCVCVYLSIDRKIQK